MKADAAREPIAIAGIGCAFPGGADSPEAFWKILSEGRDTVTPVPPSRWDAEAFYHPDSSVYGKIHCKYGSFLSDEKLETFDPLFFGIPPIAAQKMDIQQRWLLEAAYRALEDSGVGLEAVDGTNCGVYIGVSAKEYGELVMSDHVRDVIDGNSIIGNSAAICSNRISYVFNLKGPSITMDTACSSSLVALHTACRAIWNGEIDAALVGGVNAILSPEVSLAFSTGGYLAPDGRCKAFDHRADGYVRAEGVGVVYLVPASRAGDAYASILGTALTQDGFTVGISQPDADAQVRVIRNACKDAGVEPGEIRYVEAHGTGTAVGDRVEAESIGRALGQARAASGRLLVGSVKTNIGHCEPASGMAGLVKTALSIKHGRIPGNLHFEKPNPGVDFDGLNLEVAVDQREWPEGPRLAGINSFGFGGTNAHAVLGPAPVATDGKAGASVRPRSLFTLSARSRKALVASMRQYADWLGAEPGIGLADLCATQALHRSAFPWRFAVGATDPVALAAVLARAADGELPQGAASARAEEGRPGVAFVFSGQGAQWWGMAKALRESSPAFMDTLLRCREVVGDLSGKDLVAELGRDEERSIVGTSFGQLALLAVQLATTSHWASVGVKPAAVVGHSIGEVAAAWTAGSIDLEDAVRIVYRRMLVLDEISGFGTMLAVGLPERDAEKYLAESGFSAEIGTVNGPALVTFSGARDELERAAAELGAKGVYTKFLKVTGPFHSRHIERYRDRILGEFADLEPRAPSLPYYSSVTGALCAGPVFDADYTYRNLRQRVLFARAVERMVDDGWTAFLEIGPHPTLLPYVAETASLRRRPCLALPSMRRGEDDWELCMSSLSALYAQGCDIDPGAPWRGGSYTRLRPPSYPFQRERYWFEKAASRASRLGRRVHPLVESRSDLPGAPGSYAWKLMLSKRAVPWIAQHVVQDGIIFPAAGICETALGCARDAYGERFVALEGVRFMQGVYLPGGEEEEPEIVLSVSGDEGSFSVASRPADGSAAWTTHCTGRMTHRGDAPIRKLPDPAAARAAFTEADRDDFEPIYRKMAENGLKLGPSFRAIRRIWIKSGERWLGEAFGEVEADPRDAFDLDAYNIHPAILDSCWQILIPVIVRHTGDDDMLCLPVSVDQFRMLRPPRGPLSCYGRLRSASGGSFVTDVWVYDSEDRPCLEILGFTVRRIEGTGHDAAARLASIAYLPRWVDAPLVLAEGAVPTLPSDLRPGGLWLVFADASGGLDGTVAELRALGERVVVVRPAEAYHLDGDEARARRGDAGDFARLLEGLGASSGAVRGIVYGWTLDRATPPGEAHGDGLAASLEALAFVKPLCALDSPPRTWWLTNEASDAFASPDPAQAGAIGVVRVAMHENPALALALVDADRGFRIPVDEFLRKENDEEIAWLGARRLARKIERVEPDREKADALKPLEPGVDFAIVVDPASGPNATALRAVRTAKPGPGQVEVRVACLALDTRSLAPDGTGSYPARAFSGTVDRVGEGVDGFLPGDLVVGLGRFPPASRIRVPGAGLRALEADADPAAAAAAEWNGFLVDGVLDALDGHGGRGRVALVAGPASPWRELAAALGQACLAVVPLGGLEPEELDEAGLARAREGTALEADAVVCLAAEANLYLASLMVRKGGVLVLADRGRIDSGGQVPAAVLSRCRSVIAPEFEDHEPAAARASSGAPAPGSFRMFPLARTSDALAERRAGPCAVLDLRQIEGASLSPAEDLGGLIDPEAAYVVTGGLKGLGLAVAEFLAARGARHLVLAGRSGTDSDEARRGLERLASAGVETRVVRGDVADPVLSASLFAQAGMPPVRGVAHCAAVFDDALLSDLDEDRFLAVYRPKALGAYNLHKAAGRLDFFLCFSSVSAAYGNPSQANYAAANAFLDSLCLARREAGLGGLSLAWGVIGGAGYVARNAKVADMLGAQGWRPLSLRDIHEALDACLPADPGYRMVLDLDWARLGQVNPADRSGARFGALTGAGADAASSAESLADRLSALPPPEAKTLLEAELSAQVARIAGLAMEDVDLDEPITALGLDSLMVNQLRNWITAALKTQVTMMKLMMGPSVRSLAASLLSDGEQAAAAGDEADPLSKPIPATPDADSYPVTSSQRRVLLLSHLDPSSANYNIPIAVRIRAELDPRRALAAFRALVQSYETLRTSFVFEGGEFRQRVHSRVDIEATFEEFPESEIDLRLAAFFRPFDLSKAPLCRALVARLAERDHLLVIEMHHSVIDANSGGILLDAFFRLYRGEEPEAERVRYRDYAAWEEGLRRSGAYARKEAFWLDRLKGPLPTLDFPADFPRPRRQSFEGAQTRFRLGPARTGQLRDLAARTGATLPMVVLAAFKSLLHRYTGKEDMIVGLPASARRHPDLESLMGMLVSTIPLRSSPASRKRFVDYLTELKAIAIESYENQDYPFDDLFDRLAVERDLSRNPLYDVSFTFQDVDLSFSALSGDASVEAYELPQRTARFDLGLECFERDGGIDIALRYATRLFRESSARRLAEGLERLIEAVCDDPKTKIGELPVVPEAERLVLASGLERRVEIPEGSWFTHFERAAARHAEEPALLALDGRAIKYGDLWSAALGVADRLVEAGASPGDRVAVLAERHESTVVAIVGVLAAGCAFSSFDPAFPDARLAEMAADAGIGLCAGRGRLRDRATALGLRFVDIEQGQAGSGFAPRARRGGDEAYVVFTSGSTGRPKGIAVQHRALLNYCFWHNRHYGLGPGDTCSKYASFSFDGGLKEFLPTLLCGACVAVVPDDTDLLLDMEALASWMRARGVTLAYFPTPVAEEFLREDRGLPRLKALIAGGDRLHAFRVPACGLYNHYGPAECTISSTVHKVEEGMSSIPIGRPIDNTAVYVMDGEASLVPPGAYGEICIAGAGVSLGYVGGDDEGRFRPDPFRPDRMMYRTGDHGRWIEAADGGFTLEFAGRRDGQVKVRGHRVELAEIEAVLASMQGGGHTRVLVAGDSLAAFWDGAAGEAAMKAHLARFLPGYMVPAILRRVEVLPSTAHGKVDDEALRELAAERSSGAAPAESLSADEERLADIWEAVIGARPVSPADCFFELGGNSVSAMRLIHAVRRDLGIDLPMREVFSSNSLGEMTRAVASRGTARGEPVPVAPVAADYPAATSQEAILLMVDAYGASTAYNESGAVIVPYRIDPVRLAAALRLLQERHAILRTGLRRAGDTYRQFLVEDPEPPIVELGELGPADPADAAAKTVRPFDPGKPPLYRVSFGALDGKRSLMVFDFHHAIMDGSSIGIFASELAAALEGRPLPPPPERAFRDFCVWAEKRGDVEADRAWWLKTYSAIDGPFLLPVDRPRTPVPDYAGAAFTASLDAGTLARAGIAAAAAKGSLFSFLLTAMAVVQTRYAGTVSCVIGTVDEGRGRPESAGALGPFMRTLPILCEVEPRAGFLDVLALVSARLAESIDHDGFAYERLAGALGLRRVPGTHPLFQTMFAWQNGEEGRGAVEAMGHAPIRIDIGTAKFEILVDGRPGPDGGAEFTFEYRSSVYDEPSVRRLASDFIGVCREAAANPRMAAEELGRERHKRPVSPTTAEAAFDFGAGGSA